MACHAMMAHKLWQATLCICFQAANDEGLSLIGRQCGVIGSGWRETGGEGGSRGAPRQEGGGHVIEDSL